MTALKLMTGALLVTKAAKSAKLGCTLKTRAGFLLPAVTQEH